jgi:hypothetical protein
VRETAWDPDAPVPPCAAVVIRCDDLFDDDIAAWELELAAENGAYFTAGELLFRIHTSLRDLLQHNDHVFFEGLERAGANVNVGVPMYIVVLGS